MSLPALPLSGRTVAVTGASQGIGRAIAELLAASGARVLGGARDSTAPMPAGVSLLALDVANEDSVQRFAEAAIAAGVDTLVNNAGVGSFAPIDEITVEDYRRVMDTNVLGLILTSKWLIPHFRHRHAGGLASQIVNITSDVSHRTFSHGGLYTASKHAQRALSQTLAHEGAPFGVRVTEIRPGMTDTHFNGSAPGSPERAAHLMPGDIAQAVLYALSAPGHVRIDELLVHPTVQPVVF